MKKRKTQGFMTPSPALPAAGDISAQMFVLPNGASNIGVTKRNGAIEIEIHQDSDGLSVDADFNIPAVLDGDRVVQDADGDIPYAAGFLIADAYIKELGDDFRRAVLDSMDPEHTRHRSCYTDTMYGPDD